MAYGKADKKVGEWLKVIGTIVLVVAFIAVVMAAAGGAIYLVVHIASVAWHDGK